ncbi:PorP/SprF family type IX secretion system membrane protein [Chitinophaga lutea]
MKKVLIIFLLAAAAQSVNAQDAGNSSALIEPLAPQYFLNQYLGNPAFAGVDTGLHFNAAIRRAGDNQPGVPMSYAFTTDYATGKRVGLGLTVFGDEAGLLNTTRVALTYAYHLPLSASGDQRLHFGLSGGIRTERLDVKAMNGDGNDPSIGRFNRRDNYFDADFGLAYTGHRLTLQAALPNLIGYFKDANKETVNGSTFFAAASYRIPLGEQIASLEPKVCFRGVRGFDNIFDFGANLRFLDDAASVFGLYHTSGNFTAGAGVQIARTVRLQISYTSQTSGLSNYLSANFGIGLRVDLMK